MKSGLLHMMEYWHPRCQNSSMGPELKRLPPKNVQYATKQGNAKNSLTWFEKCYRTYRLLYSLMSKYAHRWNVK